MAITVKKGLQSSTLEGLTFPVKFSDLIERVSSLFLIDPDSIQGSVNGATLGTEDTIKDGDTVNLIDRVNVKGN